MFDNLISSESFLDRGLGMGYSSTHSSYNLLPGWGNIKLYMKAFPFWPSWLIWPIFSFVHLTCCLNGQRENSFTFANDRGGRGGRLCKSWEIIGRSNQQLAAVENGDQVEGLRGVSSLEVHFFLNLNLTCRNTYQHFSDKNSALMGLCTIRAQEELQALRGARRWEETWQARRWGWERSARRLPGKTWRTSPRPASSGITLFNQQCANLSYFAQVSKYRGTPPTAPLPPPTSPAQENQWWRRSRLWGRCQPPS